MLFNYKNLAWSDPLPRREYTAPPGNDFAAIENGYSYFLALRTDGSMVAWGRDAGPTPSGNNYFQIAAGYFHFVALESTP